ncbi:orotate phosphoribosyltransferase [Salibacter halophilus]|uniref:Orotate phosphoribosyltransferase n=1 Tax=Salibacter halophilus TaxID=1803916 RepID=A0A6N6MC91_9FLAO|nr:orotate phosphoribosyltransferase [Salibacter halophilus]KAB1066177.1 orotate phosphoribosyltransferase [Salibacter halophilus]
MNILDDSALKVAEFLLQIKAVVLNPNDPFQWSSGWQSPIYCDNRKTLSYPKIRNFIRQEFVKTIDAHFGRPDVIAGVATGGIPQGVLVAQEMGLPFVYVRPEAKKHGMTNQIEGVLGKDQSVIVIEDLISTGGSSMKAIKALKENGSAVKGMVAIFSYGFDLARKNLREAQCPYYTLSNYDALIEKALETNYIKQEDVEVLRNWRDNPSEWTPKK